MIQSTEVNSTRLSVRGPTDIPKLPGRPEVRVPEVKRGFVLMLPRRWVVERSFGWLARFRRLTWDYERLASTLIGPR